MASAHAVLLEVTPMPRPVAATRQVTKNAGASSGFGVLVAAHQAAKPAATPVSPHPAGAPHQHAVPEQADQGAAAAQQALSLMPNENAGMAANITLAASAATRAAMPGSQTVTSAHAGKSDGNAKPTGSSSAPALLAAGQPAVPPEMPQAGLPSASVAAAAAAVISSHDPNFAPVPQGAAPGNAHPAGSVDAPAAGAETISSAPPATFVARTDGQTAANFAESAASPAAGEVTSSHDPAASNGNVPPNRSEPLSGLDLLAQHTAPPSMLGDAARTPANTAAPAARVDQAPPAAVAGPEAAALPEPASTISAAPPGDLPDPMKSMAPAGASARPANGFAATPQPAEQVAPHAAPSPPGGRAKPGAGTVSATTTARADGSARLPDVEADAAPPDQAAPATPQKTVPAAHDTANTAPPTDAQAAAPPPPNPAVSAAPAAQAAPAAPAAPKPQFVADGTKDQPASPAEDSSQAGAVQAAGALAPAASLRPASPVAAPHAAVAPSPAAQVAQAVSGVHVAAGGQGQVTIHLQPGELGAVQVKIERAADGTATVTVQVEKAATLQAMQQDISHLHQALDRAGVPAEQRQVSLHLAAPAATGSFGSGTGSDAGPGAGNGFSRGGQSQSQQQGGGRNAAQATQATVEDEAAAPRWIAAGVNITA